ncbi:MAG: hypothetical protein EOP05_08245 [Proteobacteria bacterium]|nr:MAG: hypothetical protein EOP05_08245 [Pseudomonadota bacterium]
MKAFALAALAVTSLVSFSAFAHVEPGTHTGTTAAGTACSMVAGVTYFENNAHHPLNERIKITVDGTEFTVGHPPIIDADSDVVFFNHDLFQGIVPTATGAKALIVDMIHSEEKEGPVRFKVIENFWKTGKKESVVCEALVFAK